jgi:hypothetical protein
MHINYESVFPHSVKGLFIHVRKEKLKKNKPVSFTVSVCLSASRIIHQTGYKATGMYHNALPIKNACFLGFCSLKRHLTDQNANRRGKRIVVHDSVLSAAASKTSKAELISGLFHSA